MTLSRPNLLSLSLLAATLVQAQTPTLQTSTNLVVVDLVVTDRAGNPVSDITAADLLLTDDGKPQTLNSFTPQAATSAPKSPAANPTTLPQGTFSNAQASPASSPVLNILLLDVLNTPLADQTFVHREINNFLRAPSPGPIAIFGLTTHLLSLQGFTDDPRLLRSAVERMGSRPSTARTDTLTTGSRQNLSDTFETSLGGSDREIGPAIARLRQLEAGVQITQDRMRQHETLDALKALASYLANLPGRKNLVWFSGSFPLNLLPDSRLANPFRNTGNDLADDLRETSTLLTRAQVALYPVDARGLFNVPTYDPGARSMLDPGSLATNLQTSNQQVAEEHDVMRTMAEETGGHAFLNTNGLARAVSQAIRLGSTFYTLTYTPTPDEARGIAFHRIRLRLTGRLADSRYTLAYRRGYFPTPDPSADTRRALTATGTLAVAPAALSALRSAMMHDAPQISAISFTAEVRPVAGQTTPQPDPETHPEPHARGPWRTYTVDLLLPAASLLSPTPTGDLGGTAQFTLHAYTADGDLLSSTSSAIRLHLPADTPTRHAAPTFPVQLRISAPSPIADLSLRIGVQNLSTGVLGSLELPLAAVNNLPPAPSSPPTPLPHSLPHR